MPIYVTGLKDIRKELRLAQDAAPREITAALRPGAEKVTARANQLAPRGASGKLSSNGKPFATTTRAGVRYTLIYAPVQEFAAGVWLRRARGSGVSGVTRGTKNYVRHGGQTPQGVDQVDYTHLAPTPRFATRAVEELADGLMDEAFANLVEVLKCHGWFA